MDFHGEKRSNQTHQSKTDPEARLYKKGPGKEAKLSYQGQVLMENRNGLVTGTRLTQATGTAEREAAVEMAQQMGGRDGQRATVGADKAYDTQDFVQHLRDLNITPHVAQNTTQPLQCDRRPHDAACGLRGQPTQAQTGGRDLWLDQDGRTDAQDATSRPGTGGVDVHLHGGCLQPGADSKPQGSRVLERGQDRVPGPLEPESSPPREGETEMNRSKTFIERLKKPPTRKLFSENLSFSATCPLPQDFVLRASDFLRH